MDTQITLLKAMPRIRENIFIALREELFGGTEKMDQQVNLLKAQFKKHELNEELSKLLLEIITDTLHSDNSFVELLYIKGLLASLIELCAQQSDRIVPAKEQENTFTSIVEEHLLYFQFNHPGFIKYYQQKITDQLRLMYSLPEQFDYLCRCEKQMKTQPERAGRGYDNQSPDAKTVLCLYIEAELQYLQRRMYGYGQMQIGAGERQGQAAGPVDRHGQPVYRIKTTLSVDGLAYLIRLLVEAGAITAAPKTELLQFICRHVETPRTALSHIGYQSLLSKYKQPVQSTAISTRALLKKMLNIIEENFG